MTPETLLLIAQLATGEHQWQPMDASLCAMAVEYTDRGLPVTGDKADECDGKAFHSSSEQKRRDGIRDYCFACSDIHTMRFTGSRLWSDPFGCARDVLAELDVEKPTQRPILDVIDDLIGANAIRNAARERDE